VEEEDSTGRENNSFEARNKSLSATLHELRRIDSLSRERVIPSQHPPLPLPPGLLVDKPSSYCTLALSSFSVSSWKKTLYCEEEEKLPNQEQSLRVTLHQLQRTPATPIRWMLLQIP
jgi:hypothetical protein